MKFCCDELKPKDWKYCPFCGARIDDTTEAEEDFNDNPR